LISKCLRILGPVPVLVFLLANAAPTYGQSPGSMAIPADEQPDCDSPQLGFLAIDANPSRFADLSLTFCFDPSRAPESNQKLTAALGCPADKSQVSSFQDKGQAGLGATCKIPIQQRALQFSGQVDVRPVQNFLESAGVSALSVQVLLPRYGVERCDPAMGEKTYTFKEAVGCKYVLEGAADDPPLILYSFGYDPALIVRITSILGFLLVVPVVLILWFRHRALNAPEESKAAVVFAYRRFITGTVLGGALIWWTAVDLLHADDFVQLLVPLTRSNDDVLASVLPWILLWIPPAIVCFVCLALSSPIHSLRGLTRSRGQAVNQSFWAVARLVLPLSLFLLGFAELFSSPRMAVLFFAAWILTKRIANQKAADAYGMELQALTSGDLRDGAFAIAKKAGAKLNQVYVLPTGRIRMANAFAHLGNNIYLTDYLLKNLSRREVDAIVGHEVVHLQKKHLRTRILIWVGAMLVIGFAAAWSEKWIPADFPVGPVIYGFVLFLLFFVSRQNEFAADAGALKLTGDAEAMITALAKVSRLNTMPIHWGKLDEKILTHPSTLRRVKHLANLGGVSEARIPELLSQSAILPTDVYPIPVTALTSGKIFSTRFKARVSWIYGWILIISVAMFPTALVLATEWAHLSGRALSFALLVGIVLTFACCVAVSNFLPLMGLSKLESRVREKLEKEGAPLEIRNGLFVGLAPDSGPRIYEGNWAWDVGFLAISEDCLYYWGEEARFALRRDQITSISLGPGPVSWIKTPSVYVGWQDSGGTDRVFNLGPSRVASMSKMARQTRCLARELVNWHRGIPLPAGSLLSNDGKHIPAMESLGIPGFGQITSMSPRIVLRGNSLTRIFLLDTFVVVALAILFGLRVPILDQIAPPSAPADLNSSGGAILYVLATVWITRALQLWPFWRFREASPRPVPEAPSPAPARQL
jgi:Zn-dependent protease with chaperone function